MAEQEPTQQADPAAPPAVAPELGNPPDSAGPAGPPPDSPVLDPDDVAAQPAPEPAGDTWAFGPSVDGVSHHADGDVVPHRSFHVLRNGQPVGEASIYMRPHAGDTTFVAAFRAFAQDS